MGPEPIIKILWMSSRLGTVVGRVSRGKLAKSAPRSGNRANFYKVINTGEIIKLEPLPEIQRVSPEFLGKIPLFPRKIESGDRS